MREEGCLTSVFLFHFPVTESPITSQTHSDAPEASETAAPEEQGMGLCPHPAPFRRLSIHHRGLLTKPKPRSVMCMGEWL